MSTENGVGAFDSIRSFLEAETLTHFLSEHHHDLGVLRKGKSTIADALTVGLRKHAP